MNSMMEDEPINVPRPAERHCSVFGIQVRKITELEPIEIAFLVFANVSLIGALAMTAQRIHVSSAKSSDFIFGILLLVNLLFVFYYIFHGIFMERPFEILVSVLTVLIVMIYCIVDYIINKDRRTDLKKVRLAVVCLIGPIDIGLGIAVAIKFFDGPGNLLFRLVGANLRLQKICRTYFMFTAFLGFDFQIVLILLVLILSDSPGKMSDSEKCIIGIGVPLSAVAIFLGRLATRLENRIMSYIFLGFCVAEPVYIIYLFEKFGTSLEQAKKNGIFQKEKMLDTAVIAAAVLGLVVRIILISLAVVVIKNFGNGLKAKLYPPESDNESAYRRQSKSNEGTAN